MRLRMILLSFATFIAMYSVQAESPHLINSHIKIKYDGKSGSLTLSPVKIPKASPFQITNYAYMILKNRPEWIQMISIVCDGNHLIEQQIIQSKVRKLGNLELKYTKLSDKEGLAGTVFSALDESWKTRLAQNQNLVCSKEFKKDFSYLTLETMAANPKYKSERTALVYNPAAENFTFKWTEI